MGRLIRASAFTPPTREIAPGTIKMTPRTHENARATRTCNESTKESTSGAFFSTPEDISRVPRTRDSTPEDILIGTRTRAKVSAT